MNGSQEPTFGLKRNLAAQLEILDLQIVFRTLGTVLHFELVERQLNSAHRRTGPSHVVVALDRARVVLISIARRSDVEALLVEELGKTVQVVRAGELAGQLTGVVEIVCIRYG